MASGVRTPHSQPTGATLPSCTGSRGLAGIGASRSLQHTHFTRDGYKTDLFGGDHLKKIKELENNAAVMGQFVMWRYFLTNHGAADLYAEGYPPLRGSVLRFEKDQALLYTRGSVEFFRTYPGMYVPRPLMLRCQALGQPLQHIAAETLSLTKMNWNNTQFDNGLPITIAAARQVGEVLKYVPEGQEIAPRYSFYM